jgi:hypothetical protein
MVALGFSYLSNFKIVDTDFTGQYSFSGVRPGRFVVSAVGQFSPDPVSAESQMPVGGPTVQLNLRLQPTGRIKGTVYQPDGVTPAGASVIVKYQSKAFKVVCSESSFGETVCTSIPQGIQNETVVTQSDGTYLLPLVNSSTRDHSRSPSRIPHR